MGELSWTSHPFRENAPRSWAAAAFVLALCALAGLAGGPGGAGLAMILLGASLARYFLPTRYRLSEEGVEVRFLGRSVRRPWSVFRALYAHRIGVHLSTFVRPSPLDPFRGLFLRAAPGKGEALAAFCRERLR